MFDKARERMRCSAFVYRSLSLPEREGMPPVTLTWWDAGYAAASGRPQARGALGDGDGGSIFIGDKGVLICGCYGKEPKVYPKRRWLTCPRNAELERIPTHRRPREGLDPRLQDGKTACCSFDYGRPAHGNGADGQSGRPLPESATTGTAKDDVTNYDNANKYVIAVSRRLDPQNATVGDGHVIASRGWKSVPSPVRIDALATENPLSLDTHTTRIECPAISTGIRRGNHGRSGMISLAVLLANLPFR
jgi:hypothetical protein